MGQGGDAEEVDFNVATNKQEQRSSKSRGQCLREPGSGDAATDCRTLGKYVNQGSDLQNSVPKEMRSYSRRYKKIYQRTT